MEEMKRNELTEVNDKQSIQQFSVQMCTIIFRELYSVPNNVFGYTFGNNDRKIIFF